MQAQIAEYFGEAPANPLACDQTSDKTHCDTYKAKDEAFYKGLYFWTTPIKDCLDGRGADLRAVHRVDQGLDRGEGLGAAARRSA